MWLGSIPSAVAVVVFYILINLFALADLATNGRSSALLADLVALIERGIR